MTPAEGKKRLSQILGRKAAWRVSTKAPTAEQRAEAARELAEVLPILKAAKELKDARYRAVLAADAEYQRLFSDHKDQLAHVERLRYTTSHFKITVGEDEGWCFSVRAEGDNWAEVVRKLESKS